MSLNYLPPQDLVPKLRSQGAQSCGCLGFASSAERGQQQPCLFCLASSKFIPEPEFQTMLLTGKLQPLAYWSGPQWWISAQPASLSWEVYKTKSTLRISLTGEKQTVASAWRKFWPLSDLESDLPGGVSSLSLSPLEFHRKEETVTTGCPQSMQVSWNLQVVCPERDCEQGTTWDYRHEGLMKQSWGRCFLNPHENLEGEGRWNVYPDPEIVSEYWKELNFGGWFHQALCGLYPNIIVSWSSLRSKGKISKGHGHTKVI